jgi:hypothetical protein
MLTFSKPSFWEPNVKPYGIKRLLAMRKIFHKAAALTTAYPASLVSPKEEAKGVGGIMTYTCKCTFEVRHTFSKPVDQQGYSH